MSTFLFFVRLFVFEIYTTANVTSYNVFHGGNINDTIIINVSIYCPSFERGHHLPQTLSILSES